MADLESLIRVRRHAVEEKQKFLAALFRQAETLAMRKQVLIERLERERRALDKNEHVEASAYFARFAQGIRLKIEAVERDIKKLETRIEIAREDMRSAFADLKKIEITQERREAEEQARLKKKEDIEMDEIGIEGYRRKDDE